MGFDTATQFASQVSLNSLVQNIIYASGTVGAIFVVVGLLLIDAGGIRRRSAFNATIEKLIGFFIGFTTYFLIGFAIWASQYYTMFEGVTFMDSIKDWWAGGIMLNALAQNVDPAVFPGLNTFQIFVFFLACFAGIINVLLHFAVSERMKASAFYLTSFVATIVSSYLSLWTWGSVGALTTLGFHDFFGVGFVYLFPAGMAMVFINKLGVRPGMFSPYATVTEYRMPNLALATVGVLMIFASLPMVILSCLFFFDPEAYAVSVTMAETSIGIVFNNYGVAWAGGALMGAILAYATRKYSYLLLGPFAGYVAGAAGFDVYVPWQMFLVSFSAPIVAYLIYEFMLKRHIDEHKLLPIFAGAGSYGLIMVGILHQGTPRGGYFGIEEGIHLFQHGQIELSSQLIGIVVCLGTGIITALILSFILERTTGLHVSDQDQAQGLDKTYWDLESDVQPNAEN